MKLNRKVYPLANDIYIRVLEYESSIHLAFFARNGVCVIESRPMVIAKYLDDGQHYMMFEPPRGYPVVYVDDNTDNTLSFIQAGITDRLEPPDWLNQNKVMRVVYDVLDEYNLDINTLQIQVR